ncbi:hypothetical protein E8E14_007746 [Neopestalotiopsis sp. 37M]|nr:hypothetical protein E8E14_007746 [Neopestalotiopsis sp. 37M]
MSRGLLPADDDIDLFWGGGRTTDTSGKLPAIQEHETEVSMRHLPDLAKYMKILHISYSYRWLLCAIEKTQVLQIPDRAAETCSIERQLINGMRMPGAMGMHLNTFVELEFQVDWGFRVFHNEQAYSESLETVLETAITLTGNHNSVQAITCIDYVRQTWGTEGAELVLFLQKLVQSSSVSSPGRGSSGANYDSIMHSGLGQPRSFVAFDRISVSTGKIINVGVSASIGNKDKSWQINFDDDYVRTLSAIAARHFLFYDVSERQAWLIDGVSTVLHALRTCLKGCKSNEILQAVVLPGFDELIEADDEFFGARAAFDVLQKNRDRPLWPQHKRGASNQEDQFFRVEAKVREICTALQQITAHVDNMRDGAGFRLKLNPRDQLEGFDFTSLASDEPTFRPKVHTISASGEAWVDFTRAIYTPTLFGRGFGHMFQPFEKACETCKWNEPPGKDLLAVSVKDLKQIIKKYGNSDTNPCLLAPKIVWLTPDQCFESCNCSTASPIKRDRVQVCLSDGFRARLLRDTRSPTELFDDDGQYDRGAVLFGYSSKMRW